LQSIPNAIQEGHELETLVLEYRRECGQSEVVQSLASTESSSSSSSSSSYTAWAEAEESNNGCTVNSKEEATAPLCLDGSLSSSSELQEISNSADQIGPLQFTHLLRLQVDGVEIVRGSTLWRLKKLPFHTQ